MRLLLLVPDPLPAFRVDVTVLFGQYLPREGVESDVIGRALPGVAEQEQGFASARRSSAAGGRLAREWSYLRLAASALLGARASTCDAIVVRDMASIGLLAALVARRRGIPCAYWMSYLMSEGRRARAVQAGAWRTSLRATLVWLKGAVEEALLYRVVLPLCRHVFVQSDAMREHVARQGVPADRMTPVPMGVDTETVRPEGVTPAVLPDWPARPTIAYLGTLESARRPEVLLDMLRRVRTRHPAAGLLLVGDAGSPAATEALRRHIRETGLDDAVRVTGWLPISQGWPLMRGADVSVAWIPRSPVLDTNSPTKLIESLALGVPSVASDNPDQAEVLRRTGAGWLAGSDADSLAEAVCAVLSDPVAARERAARGPAAIDALRSYRVIAAGVAASLRALKG